MTTTSEKDIAALEAILAIYDLSSTNHSLEDQLNRSLETLVDLPWLTKKRWGRIYIAHTDTRSLTLVAEIGADTPLTPSPCTITYDNCAFGKAVENGDFALQSSAKSLEERSDHCPNYHAVPIKKNDNVVGVLAINISDSLKIDSRRYNFLLKIGNILGQLIQRHNNKVQSSTHDALTGLANRALITKRITTALTIFHHHSDSVFAMLFLDLDHFKTITENLGYSVGDEVLKKIADRILKFTDSKATIGRLGGDEFGILLEDVQNSNNAMSIAKDIQNKIQMPMDLNEDRISLSVSIGIVMGDAKYKKPEEIIRDGVIALHAAKEKGKGGCLLFCKEMHQAAVSRLQTQKDLRNGLSKDEVIVFYQPIFSLKDLRLRGFEALARWNHPTRGIIGPDSFIPVAEETGLILPLGDQVLKMACNQLKKWRIARLPLAWISVNLSAHQFKLDELVPKMTRVLKDSGAEPRRLMIEITEGTAAESPERAVRMMRELRDVGIRIALDDFGTGYSSMSYLKRFPIDALKIDRSFVKDLPESQDDAAIVSAVIAMAQGLGMKVVAEGVENERQALYLRSLGCDEVQGFLYARPMTADDATAFLKKTGGRVSH